MHDVNLMDGGVVAHVRGGEGFACKASNPIAELVVMSHDKDALLKIQGVTYGKFGVVSTTPFWKVWSVERGHCGTPEPPVPSN